MPMVPLSKAPEMFEPPLALTVPTMTMLPPIDPLTSALIFTLKLPPPLESTEQSIRAVPVPAKSPFDSVPGSAVSASPIATIGCCDAYPQTDEFAFPGPTNAWTKRLGTGGLLPEQANPRAQAIANPAARRRVSEVIVGVSPVLVAVKGRRA